VAAAPADRRQRVRPRLLRPGHPGPARLSPAPRRARVRRPTLCAARAAMGRGPGAAGGGVRVAAGAPGAQRPSVRWGAHSGHRWTACIGMEDMLRVWRPMACARCSSLPTGSNVPSRDCRSCAAACSSTGVRGWKAVCSGRPASAKGSSLLQERVKTAQVRRARLSLPLHSAQRRAEWSSWSPGACLPAWARPRRASRRARLPNPGGARRAGTTRVAIPRRRGLAQPSVAWPAVQPARQLPLSQIQSHSRDASPCATRRFPCDRYWW